MAFFDELGKKITQTGQDVVQKTKGTAETIKLNNTISEEEKRINSLYHDIGQVYFELHKDSHEPVFERMISEIKEAQSKIEDCTNQINKLKGIVPCPNCGGEVVYGVPFCSSCGAKMNIQESPASAPDTDTNQCVKCGLSLPSEALFCTNCGTKVGAAPTDEKSAASAKQCPNCGKTLAIEAQFCTECGTKV